MTTIKDIRTSQIEKIPQILQSFEARLPEIKNFFFLNIMLEYFLAIATKVIMLSSTKLKKHSQITAQIN